MSRRNYSKYKETQFYNKGKKRIVPRNNSSRSIFNRRVRSAQDPFVLPPIKNAPAQTRAIRYVATSGNSASTQTLQFRSKDLLSLMGMATTTSSWTSVIESAQLTGIRVSAVLQPTSVADSATLSFTWKGQYTREEEIAFTVSQLTPVNVFLQPPPDSNADWWYSASTDILDLFMITWMGEDMQLTVDLHFSYVLPHGQDNTLEVLTGSGLTAGKFYYPEVPAVGTSIQLSPVGLDTF